MTDAVPAPEPPPVREYVERTLDRPYVRSTAHEIAIAATIGKPLEVCYQPGDGTRYDLVFVPIWSLDHAPGRVRDDGIVWDELCAFGVGRRLGSTLLSWYDHMAYPVDLASGGLDGGYIGEKFKCGPYSGWALALLLNEAGEELAPFLPPAPAPDAPPLEDERE